MSDGERAESLAEMVAERHARAGSAAVSPERFRHLPERVRLAGTAEDRDTSAGPDPTGGRDVERDRLLLFGGAG